MNNEQEEEPLPCLCGGEWMIIEELFAQPTIECVVCAAKEAAMTRKSLIQQWNVKNANNRANVDLVDMDS